MKTTAIAFILMIMTGTAAASSTDQALARELMERGEIVSVESLVDVARKRNGGGRVLEIELKQKHGRYEYEIEMVNDRGLVTEFYFDARTGELIREEAGDD